MQQMLTAKETTILQLVAEGYTNSGIAQKVGIQYCTVRNHMTHILEKMNTGSRVQAVVMAIQKGYISVPESKE